MPIHWKHLFQSAKSDGPDTTLVRPSSWNADHVQTSDEAGIVVGRDSTGPGDMQSLPASWNPIKEVWNFFAGTNNGGLTPPSGTSAQRPPSPDPGTIRYNTDTGQIEVYGLGGSTTWTTVAAVGGNAPPGCVMWFPAAAIPAGWFYCNGQAVPRTLPLFAVIGTGYGGGDGSTTFNVPNYIDLVFVGVGSTYGLNTRRGQFSYSAGVPLPSHYHNFLDQNGGQQVSPRPRAFGLGGMGGGNVLQWDDGIYLWNTDAQGSGGAAIGISCEQPSVGLYPIIKGY